jgi:hypothetical protein
MVDFESNLEHDFIYRLDVDPTIVHLESQPVEIPLVGLGGAQHYTPDFLVHGRSAVDKPVGWLYEVKYLDDLLIDWADLKPRFAAAGQYALERDLIFLVLTEYEIRTPYLDNAKRLWDYCRRPACQSDQARILQSAIRSGRSTLGELLSTLDDLNLEERSPYVIALYQLLAERRIKTDLESPLTLSSDVWM